MTRQGRLTSRRHRWQAPCAPRAHRIQVRRRSGRRGRVAANTATRTGGVPPIAAAPLPPRAPAPYQRFGKPTLDRVLALLALVLTTPLLLAVAIAVASSLGRPLLFRQERVGLDGEPFRMLKFRTMRPDRRRRRRGDWQGREHRRTHKSADDPRHVPVGRFLRRYSLDELPQLWNVARGDMSLVGPRPELVDVVRGYEPWQHARHAVKPGITGLWQVTDRANGELMLHHTTTDLRYVEQMSLVTDVKIMALTIPTAMGVTGVMGLMGILGPGKRT